MPVFGEPYGTIHRTVLITVTRRGGPGRAVELYTVNAAGVTWTAAVDQGRI